MTKQSKVLVVGATGNVGRHVVSMLHAQGAPVRALSRRPESAQLPASVEVVPGDLTRADTLDAALDGIDTVFLVWRRLPVEAAPPVVDAISKYARRLVFLSSMAVRDDLEQQVDPIGQLHASIERSIEASGLEWSFLRPAEFATNTLEWAPQIRAGDVVRGVYGASAMTLIHERDVAAVAVRALCGAEHIGAKHPLTGSEVLTQAEAVSAIGGVIGRPLRWEESSPEEERERLLGWLSPSFAEFILELRAKAVHRTPPVTSTVEEVTGAPARTFREWVVDHAGDFR
jgi:uncharacterized protein YbjT (DUF2867 family)